MKRHHDSIEQQITRNAAYNEWISITVQFFKKNVDVFSLSEIKINHRHVLDNEESQWSNFDLQNTFESESQLESYVHWNYSDHLNQQDVIFRTI
jgi:hypothetical protein